VKRFIILALVLVVVGVFLYNRLASVSARNESNPNFITNAMFKRVSQDNMNIIYGDLDDVKARIDKIEKDVAEIKDMLE